MPVPVLHRSQALVLAIDLQERLAAAMDPATLPSLRRNAVMLLEGAKALGVPVLASEQYPRGLGPTLPDVAAALPVETRPLEKLAFSCWAEPTLRAALEATGRRQAILCGIEAHVCVFQTARDLAAAGFQVFLPVDAVSSRTPGNATIGLDLARTAGAVLTSVEAVLFDLLGSAADPAFRAVSRLVK